MHPEEVSGVVGVLAFVIEISAITEYMFDFVLFINMI